MKFLCRPLFIVITGIIFVLLFCVGALLLKHQSFVGVCCSHNTRISSVGNFFIATLEMQKIKVNSLCDFHVKDSTIPTVSWRYKVYHSMIWSGFELNLNEPYDSTYNTYQRELGFAGISYPCFLRRGVPINQLFDTSKWNTTELCYEYPDSYYTSTLDENTNILMIKGKGTLVDNPYCSLKWETLPKNLLVLVEVHTNIHWTEPFDINVEDLLANMKHPRYEVGLKADNKGFYCLFMDGSVWYLKKNTPLELLGKLALVEFAEKHNREDVLDGFILKKQ